MTNRVLRFNHIVGNAPVGGASKEAFITQLDRQQNFIQEEVNELSDGIWNSNIVEILDAACNIWYLNQYVFDMLEAIGVDVVRAREIVCENNDQKFTTSPEYASASCQSYGIGQCYVDQTVYDGIKYYTVRCNSDGKVQKLLDHEKPDFTECIPDHVLEYFKEDE